MTLNPSNLNRSDSNRSAAYRREVATLASALAAGDEQALAVQLAAGPRHVALFSEGNLDKRVDKLGRFLEFIAPAFPDLLDWLARYVREVPLAAGGLGGSDEQQFLRWLLARCKCTRQQRDYLTCQHARHCVEELARARRGDYLRFAELSSVATELGRELESDPRIKIQVNPVRVWARFTTAALLEDQAEPPAVVLFYAGPAEIRTALLEPDSRVVVTRLASRKPCTLAALRRSLASNIGDIEELCRDLSTIGLVAFC
jgi:hypothetical protein